MVRTSFLQSLWVVGIVLELLIAGAILVRRCWTGLPFVLAYCAWDLSFDVLLERNHKVYSAYFFTYWLWQGGSHLIRLGVIADVVRSLPGADFLRRSVRDFCLSVALGVLVGSLLLALHAQREHYRQVITFVHLLDEAGSFLVAALVLAAFHAVRSKRAWWSMEGRGIAGGLAIKAIAGLFCAQFLSWGGVSASSGTLLLACSAVATLLIWSFTLVYEPLIALVGSTARVLKGSSSAT